MIGSIPHRSQLHAVYRQNFINPLWRTSATLISVGGELNPWPTIGPEKPGNSAIVSG